ncbi:hypothetical protein BJ546DRAFT_308536 [Cryomyces antarcticus]
MNSPAHLISIVTSYPFSQQSTMFWFQIYLDFVPTTYKYNFEALARTISPFLAALPMPLKRHSIYIFEDEAPTGLHFALGNPSAVIAIVSQNGNAYEEGLSSFWDSSKEY